MRINRMADPAPSGGGGTPPPAAGLAFDPTTMAPEDVRSAPSLGNIKTVQDLAKSYVNAQQLIGEKRFAIPKSADPKDWNDTWNALGRPESPEKYSAPEVKPLEGVNMDDKVLGEARKVFHGLGLTDAQQKGLMKFYIEGVNGQHAAMTQQLESGRLAATETLKKDWGAQYDVNMDVAKSVIGKFATEGALDELATGLGNNPELARMFHKIGSAMMEDTSRGGGTQLNVGGPAAATAKIAELRRDTKFMEAFLSNGHAGHKDAVNQMLELQRQVDNSKKAVA